MPKKSAYSKFLKDNWDKTKSFAENSRTLAEQWRAQKSPRKSLADFAERIKDKYLPVKSEETAYIKQQKSLADFARFERNKERGYIAEVEEPALSMLSPTRTIVGQEKTRQARIFKRYDIDEKSLKNFLRKEIPKIKGQGLVKGKL